MAVSAALVAVGVGLLVVFCWFVWPPLALLPVSVSCLAAGALVDWEQLSGKPDSTADRR